jgi:hypothetical protein
MSAADSFTCALHIGIKLDDDDSSMIVELFMNSHPK